jgi:hypothetical protein
LSLKRNFLLGFLLVVSALALAACGSSESDEDKVVDVIETSITTNDPANCTTLETQAFVEQGSDESGKAAIADCEKEAEDEEEEAESVEVTEVEVNGENATANAAITGGGFNGQTLSVALVKSPASSSSTTPLWSRPSKSSSKIPKSSSATRRSNASSASPKKPTRAKSKNCCSAAPRKCSWNSRKSVPKADRPSGPLKRTGPAELLAMLGGCPFRPIS